MPGTNSNSGRCSLLYHSLNSCTCWASISTYTMKIPRPFCAMCPSPLCSVAAIVLPRLVGTRSSRLEPRRDTRHQLGSHLSFKVRFTPRRKFVTGYRYGWPDGSYTTPRDTTACLDRLAKLTDCWEL